jgi:hypothetical protein
MDRPSPFLANPCLTNPDVANAFPSTLPLKKFHLM